jgi:hypothetical protein
MEDHIRTENAWHQWKCAAPGIQGNQAEVNSEEGTENIRKFLQMTYFGHPPRPPGHIRTLDQSLSNLGRPRGKKGRVVITPLSGSKFAKLQPLVGLGSLDRLPLEVLHDIISDLDIATVHSFKGMNRMAYRVVNAHPQVQLLISESQPVLHGLFAVKLAHTVTVEALFDELSKNPVCVECGDFGGYLYLLTLERACLWCLGATDRFRVVRETVAPTKFGLSPDALRRIPHIESFPADRFGDGPDVGNYRPYFDRGSVIKAAIERHGSKRAMSKFARGMDNGVLEFYKR